MIIDLRSDFLGRPTAQMLKAMRAAAARPSGFHFSENADLVELEEKTSELLGKERSLFCPTCTMCNQIAIALCCKPGDTFVTEMKSHIATTERGSAALISGASPVFVDADRGNLDLEQLAGIYQGISDGRDAPRLITLENTHVHSGGSVLAGPTMKGARLLADQGGATIHLDGARLFNAAVHDGVTVRDLAVHADTVSISLNKGLGAPMGAILAGDDAAMGEAAQVRRLLGGAWRSAGMMAAAALAALSGAPDLIRQDHLRARRLAAIFERCSGVTTNIREMHTNIVFVYMALGGEDYYNRLVQHLERNGIRILNYSTHFRMVIYSEIDDEVIEMLDGIIDNFVERKGS